MAELLQILPENVWTEKYKYAEAERLYYELAAASSASKSKIIEELERARSQIRESLQCVNDAVNSLNPTETQRKPSQQLSGEVDQTQLLLTRLDGLEAVIGKLESRIVTLEKAYTSQLKDLKAGDNTARARSLSKSQDDSKASIKVVPKQEEKPKDDDDDVDLFGSDSEVDEEAEKAKQQRLAEYAERKSKKPAVIAKSNVILDIKPWDDETDMAEMEKQVRAIQLDGLLWGASKLVPLAYGIKKLQISTVVEDDKVSVDELTEMIEALEDLVQSVDIAAFNKI